MPTELDSQNPNYPKNGDYFYHYKHNSNLDINNFAYQIIGFALHTETEETLVIYKPLYKLNHIFEASFFARPLSVFLEKVELNGQRVPRFSKIIDQEISKNLGNYHFSILKSKK